MLNSKEIASLLIITLVLGVSISFLKGTQAFLNTLMAIFLVLLINTSAKKIASIQVDSEIEIKPWEIRQYGFKKHSYFKKPFQAGIFFPIIFSVLSLGNFIWMASLVFDVKPKIYRAAKRHGLYSFSEMTEYHIGFIAAIGIVANLLFAVIGYFIGFPDFARLNIYLAAFNMIPLSDLDGNKIFFGSLVLWSFLAALILVALGYAFFLT